VRVDAVGVGLLALISKRLVHRERAVDAAQFNNLDDCGRFVCSVGHGKGERTSFV